MECPHCQPPYPAGWSFCGYCGRSLGRLKDIATPKRHHGDGQATMAITLEGLSDHPVETEVEVLDALNAEVRLDQNRLTIRRIGGMELFWRLGEGATTGRCSLRVRSKDGYRSDPFAAESWRHQDIEIDFLSTKPEGTIEPQTLAFAPGRQGRKAKVLNTGIAPVSIGSLEASPSYRVVPSAPLPVVLDRNQAFEFELRPVDPLAPEPGYVLVNGEGFESSAEIVCHTNAPSRIQPDSIVGIDFGTGNTSVVVRKQGATMGSFLEFEGQKRFLTAIYCPSNDESTWVMGPKAVDSYKAGTGVLFLELKLKLQQPDADLDPKLSGVTPRKLLTWYFRQILDRLVRQFFQQNDPQALRNGNLEFVLSIPVLDNGPAQEAQRRLTLECAAAAGLERLGRLSSEIEPACAAAYLIFERKRHELTPGQTMLVFDSGAGTTDLVFGRLASNLGRIELRDRKVGAAVLEGNRQFGGSRITMALGRRFNRTDGLYFFERARQRDNPDEVEFEPANRHEDDPSFRPWRDRLPTTFERIDQAKRAALTSPENPGAAIVFPRGTTPFEANEVRVVPDDVNDIVDTAMNQLGSTVRSLPGEDETDLVFALGGNSLVPRIRSRLGALQPGARLVELTDEERNLAVPAGTVWATHTVTGYRPYGIRAALDIDGHTQQQLFEEPAGSWAPRPSERKVELAPGSKLRLDIDAEIDGRWQPLIRRTFRNEGGVSQSVVLKVEVVDLQVAASATDRGSPIRELQWEYSL
ncbi:MAG TPA: hypothetical protein VGE01_02125 [Fimbriimonas sp.]